MNWSRSSSLLSLLNAARSSSVMIQRTSSSSHFLYVLLISFLNAFSFSSFCFSVNGRFRGSVSCGLACVSELLDWSVVAAGGSDLSAGFDAVCATQSPANNRHEIDDSVNVLRGENSHSILRVKPPTTRVT